MPHSLVCWRCGASLAALSLPLRRLDVCKACNAELHVCKMCVEYDTSYAKHCKEPTAEEVRKKDEANFCDHFKPKEGAYVAKESLAPDSTYCECAAAAALRRLTLNAATSDARTSFSRCVKRGIAKEPATPSMVTTTTNSTSKLPWRCG